jgi:hypothetical protein
MAMMRMLPFSALNAKFLPDESPPPFRECERQAAGHQQSDRGEGTDSHQIGIYAQTEESIPHAIFLLPTESR